jgi:hypothetical protein
MTRKIALLTTSKLTMAAFVAAGLSATPAVLTGDLQIASNAAVAQDEGQAENFVNGGAGGTTDVSANVYRILGTTPEEVGKEVMSTTTTSAGPLPEYQAALRDGDLDSAADVLAAVSNRPISEELVQELNATLGVETTLTIQRIASVAAERQDPANFAMVPAMDGSPYEGMYDMAAGKQILEQDYDEAMTAGNLNAAADALARAFERPITEDLVLRVNNDLGVESTLTAKQVAIEAAKRQKM